MNYAVQHRQMERPECRKKNNSLSDYIKNNTDIGHPKCLKYLALHVSFEPRPRYFCIIPETTQIYRNGHAKVILELYLSSPSPRTECAVRSSCPDYTKDTDHFESV